MNRILIGLTGNIATGKSVVRRMLVNHGALGLDADMIAHRMLYPGGRAYQPVIETFGPEILNSNHEISRSKLGEIVFSDPQRLDALEELVHPAVTADIEERIRQAVLPMVVIEAIKLLETPLAELCQSIWVSQASPAHQMERLLHDRNMTEEQARERIDAQSPQAAKRKRANVVINTEGDFRETWLQIRQALNDTIQLDSAHATPYINSDQKFGVYPAGIVPPDALTSFWEANSGRKPDDLYEQLAFNVVQAVCIGQQVIALLISEDWNFTSSLNVVISARVSQLPAEVTLNAFYTAAQDRQSELLLLSECAAANLNPGQFGYERRTAQSLPFPAWQQAIARQNGSEEQPVWVRETTQISGQF